MSRVLYYAQQIGLALRKRLGFPLLHPRRYAAMYRELRTRPIPAANILEIGTNTGANASRLIRAGTRDGTVPAYYGIDLFEEQDAETQRVEFSIPTASIRQVESFLRSQGATKVALFRGDSTIELPKLTAGWPEMDLIFIDGGHSFQTVSADWKNVQPLIGDRTVVFFDDYPNYGVKPVVDAIDRSAWDVRVIAAGDRFPVTEFLSGKTRRRWLKSKLARVKRRAATARR